MTDTVGVSRRELETVTVTWVAANGAKTSTAGM